MSEASRDTAPVSPLSSAAPSAYDAVVVGGGHNGLVAAAYLARAGQRVLVLERLPHTGGAAVSEQTFAGVDARLSRYSYLVSLLPQQIVDDLGLRFAVRKRDVSSYTPTVRDGRHTGLLIGGGTARTREAFRQLTGSDREFESWERFYGMTQRVAERVFPTLTQPLPTRAELRARVGDDSAWEALFERPLGEAVEQYFADDLVRGVVLTDGLIGTFSHAHDPSLLQNRCFLYHVIGGGTGDWDVPVGGMGAFTDALAGAARAAGADIRTGHTVHRIDTDDRAAQVRYRTDDGTEGAVAARRVLVGASPQTLAELLGEDGPGPLPGEGTGGTAGANSPARAAGSQLKVNMLLRRLPRLKNSSVDPREAFAGTFHVAEGYGQLVDAHRQAAAGELPERPPSELYCHSLTDPTILGPELAAEGCQTLTLFGLLTPPECFEGDAGREALKEAALARTLAELDEHLAEPLADCLAQDADGRPCIEAKAPQDLEDALRLPGGHIFHGDLSFPWASEEGSGIGDGSGSGSGSGSAEHLAARWGVATGHPNILLCGAGSVRGGGVSGIGGHNAAMAALETDGGPAPRS